MGAIVSTSNAEATESRPGSDESTSRDSTDQPPEEPPGFKWVAGRRSTLGEGANSNLVLPADDELTDSRQILHYCLRWAVWGRQSIGAVVVVGKRNTYISTFPPLLNDLICLFQIHFSGVCTSYCQRVWNLATSLASSLSEGLQSVILVISTVTTK